MKKAVVTIFLLATLVGAGFISVKYYSYLFSRKVFGRIYQIERVTNPSLILGGNSVSKSPEAMYSFAVALRTSDGEIVTASSEDRQWAIARQGLCAEAKFYPYPPWNFEKSGTYFNARLVKLKDCPEELKNLPGDFAPQQQQSAAKPSVPAPAPAQEEVMPHSEEALMGADEEIEVSLDGSEPAPTQAGEPKEEPGAPMNESEPEINPNTL